MYCEANAHSSAVGALGASCLAGTFVVSVCSFVILAGCSFSSGSSSLTITIASLTICGAFDFDRVQTSRKKMCNAKDRTSADLKVDLFMKSI